jgi:hypothetical protein
LKIVFQSQRDLLPDDPFEAALIMHAESLVRAENQPQQSTFNPNDSTTMMMDLTRDGLLNSYRFTSFYSFIELDSYLTTSQTIENLPELDLEAHYIDPVTSNDPEVQKVELKNKFFETIITLF